ncbi:hypothetical protein [Mumia zhuanghuii]|uniref:Secreted protein n=1 Tax=Mumia zhuanghuii TaxID=2585211 RepID=A0A5C4MBC8_9ACTN|nr:hypothetical protein [Mumia zhuanghuii]TNC33696.1 hypothetical protein FHE65_28530 [Mumia zhuanghuii]TNC33926.1 hypothetical protein FHE65_28310 [Mumia zhuanghuii]
MLSRSRTAVRSAVAGALVASPLLAVAAATPAAADVPVGWEDAESSLTPLSALLIFAGIPLAIALVLALFGYVLARRTTPSYLPYIAAPGAALPEAAERSEITSGY